MADQLAGWLLYHLCLLRYHSIVILKLSIMILKFRRRENFKRDFPGKLWSWAWFFWRPLLEGNFEIFLETLQLYRIPNPIWFCNCKLRYMVWVIWESKLIHIQFLANLKNHFVLSFLPSLPSSLKSLYSRS